MNFISRRRLARFAIALLLPGRLPAAPRPAQALPQAANSRVAGKAVHWTASWAAAPQLYGAAAPNGASTPATMLADVSLRQRLRPCLGGGMVRVRFSNVFGSQDLHIAGASIADEAGVADAAGAANAANPATAAAAASAPDAKPGSLRALRFGGRGDITIAPGAEAWSDAVAFAADPRRPLVVSFRLDQSTPISTVHHLPPDSTWMLPGDASMQAHWPDATPSAWNHIVTGLDVKTSGRPARVLVAFGDSITEGWAATEDHGQPVRYPELLARRLAQAHERNPRDNAEFAVINAGISGNRLLVDWVGPSGLDRFGRDVLGQSGASHVLIMIGVNDIGLSLPAGAAGPVRGVPSARELAAGLRQLIEQARASGVKVLLGTLLPFEGASYWSAEKERRRSALNDWIRSRKDVAGVVDFDAALRDPMQPGALRAGYDSGDHLHPGNAGYAAMADAVDLRLLGR